MVRIKSLHQQQRRHKKGISKKYHTDPVVVEEVRNMRQQGYTLSQISEATGVKLSTAWKQCRDVRHINKHH